MTFSGPQCCIVSNRGVERNVPVESMAEALELETGNGAYTVGHTYEHTKVLLWPEHLERLRSSMSGLGATQLFSQRALESAMLTLLQHTGWEMARFRIFVPLDTPEQIILTLEPYADIPEETRWKGVECVTLPQLSRGDHPELKQASWGQLKEEAAAQLPEGIHTGLLLSGQNTLLEGLDSNFFAIRKGELITAGDGVLPGLTQQTVLQIAPSVLPVSLQALPLDEVETIDEAFITSSSRGILPVVTLDGQVIGDGSPGPFSRKLWDAYQGWIQANLTSL